MTFLFSFLFKQVFDIEKKIIKNKTLRGHVVEVNNGLYLYEIRCIAITGFQPNTMRILIIDIVFHRLAK